MSVYIVGTTYSPESWCVPHFRLEVTEQLLADARRLVSLVGNAGLTEARVSCWNIEFYEHGEEIFEQNTVVTEDPFKDEDPVRTDMREMVVEGSRYIRFMAVPKNGESRDYISTENISLGLLERAWAEGSP